MYSNTNGSQNIGIGVYSGHSNKSGSNNVAIGANAIYSDTNGVNNVAIGASSLDSNKNGSSNIAIGQGAGYACLGSGNIFLGYQAGYNETSSNKLYIANSNTSSPLIYGDFSTNKVTINNVVKLVPQSSAPLSPTEGELYVNSTVHHIYCYLNGVWKQLD